MIDENGILNLTGIKKLNKNYQYNKKLKKLIIGNTLEKIDAGSFIECSNLEEFDFSNTIWEDISNECFSNCKYLKSIHLPPSIKYIGLWAFKDCTHLKSVILDGVNEIYYFAF